MSAKRGTKSSGAWLLSLNLAGGSTGDATVFRHEIQSLKLGDGVRRWRFGWVGRSPATDPLPGELLALYWSTKGRAPQGPGVYAVGRIVEYIRIDDREQLMQVDFEEEGFDELFENPILRRDHRSTFEEIGIRQGPVQSYYHASSQLWSRLIAGRTIITGTARAVVDERDSEGTDSVIAFDEQGRESDPLVRKAIELQAMRRALRHYRSKGYEVEDTSASEAYDMRCTRGSRVIHVEVKGTRSSGEEVILTAGEVRNAYEHPTELFIVSGIVVKGRKASGGQVNIHRSWTPEEKDLEATQYRYRVPGG